MSGRDGTTSIRELVHRSICYLGDIRNIHAQTLERHLGAIELHQHLGWVTPRVLVNVCLLMDMISYKYARLAKDAHYEIAQWY